MMSIHVMTEATGIAKPSLRKMRMISVPVWYVCEDFIVAAQTPHVSG